MPRPTERLIRHDPEALALWTEMTRREVGANQHSKMGDDNINTLPGRPTGTSREQALRRLAKEADGGNEAAAAARRAVLAGERSPHGALVELGLRRRAITIPADVEGAAPGQTPGVNFASVHMKPQRRSMSRDLWRLRMPWGSVSQPAACRPPGCAAPSGS